MKRSSLRKKDLSPLYEWFLINRRNLPFRSTKDPYRIWVSEVMLQQTRMSVVEEKYREFVKRFPDIKSLARSDEDDVLPYWRGLGYYSRCRNLRKGAVHIQDHFGGRFPGTLEDALQIPGVGKYTAAAVLSIALDLPHAVLDGNVRRVLSRLYHPVSEDETTLQNLADDLMDERSAGPGQHNEALMELGALVCRPGIPLCDLCPLKKNCGLFRAGSDKGMEVPARKKTKNIEVDMNVFIVRDAGKRILISKRNDLPFFKNAWFFPYEAVIEDENSQKKKDGALKIYRDAEGKKYFPASLRHHITNHKITVNLHWMECGKTRIALPDAHFAEMPDLRRKVVSSLGDKIFSFLKKEGVLEN